MKQLLSLLTALCMLMSFAPMGASAAAPDEPAAAVSAGDGDTAEPSGSAQAAEEAEPVEIALLVGETYDFGTLTGDFRSAAGAYSTFTIQVPEGGFTDAVDPVPAVPVGTEALVSGSSYLIGDGSGHYLSVSGNTVADSTDPLTATMWTLTVSDDTYAFTAESQGSTIWLACDWEYKLGCSWVQAEFSLDSSGFYATRDGGSYYLDYADDGWTLTKDGTVGTAAALYTQETIGSPGTPASTVLLLTATEAGSESVVIGGTVYRVTVSPPVTSARCEEHDVTVSGSGIDGLVCAADDSVTAIAGYESVDGVEISAYRLTPSVGGAAFTGNVTVRMPLPEQWTAGRIQAFSLQDGTAAVIPAAISDGYAVFTVPGGSVCGLFRLPAGYYTSEVSILMGNQSVTTRILPGAYTAGDVYYCDDTGLVSVTAEESSPYVPAVPAGPVSAIDVGSDYYITDGNGNYLTIADGAMANTTDIALAAVWNCHSSDSGTYRLISGGFNLTNSNDTNNVFRISADGGGSYLSPYFDPELGLYKNGHYLIFDGENWTTGTETAGHSIVYGLGSDAVSAKSTVTITSGESTGTTSVIVGTTRYTITVAEQSLVGSTVTILSMITNDLVKIGQDESGAVCHVDISAAMPGAASEDGIDITSLFPANGQRKNDTTVFWKMTWLPSGHHQKIESGSPYLNETYSAYVSASTDGMTGYDHRVDFTRLRFCGGRWEFFLDYGENPWYTGEKWGNSDSGWYPVSPTAEDVTTLGMSGVSAGDGQIVAYYLQVTDVTQEVTTNVADWGPAIDDGTNIGYGADYVLLDFAVRYEDGVRNPGAAGTFPYAKGGCSADGQTYASDKTMGFHCKEGWGGVTRKADGTVWRTINTILATTDMIHGYEIYMITTTRSADSTPLAADNMSRNKRLSSGGGYDYDTATETIVWLKDENVSCDDGTYLLAPDVAYGYRENGTHTGGVPLVNAVTIQNQHALLVTYYVRYVGRTSDDLGVHYINRTLNDLEFYTYGIHVSSGTVFDPAFGRVDGTEYGLTGNAVENYYGVTQAVQGDPRNILDVGSFYRSTKLTLVEVRRSDDGKDVYLYYTTDNAKDMVIDFGLPVEITAGSLQLQLNPGETVSRISCMDGTDPEAAEEPYSIQKTDYGCYYTDLTSGRCWYIPTSVMRGTETVRLAVATSETTQTNPHQYVHSIHPATTMYYEQYFASYDGTWEGSTRQSAPGADYISRFPGTQQSAYPGMDGANNYGYDGVYISAAKTQAAAGTPGAKASFGFTGDGFEICADCTQSTGTVMVALYGVDGQTETMKSVYMVDTARKSGESSLTDYPGDSGNTPIVSVRDLAYGDYRVTMVLTGYSQPSFVFDGFRIFNTMGSTIDDKVYALDSEARPGFAEVRDSVLAAKLPDKDSVDPSSVYADQIARDISGQVYALKGSRPIQAVVLGSGEDALTDAVVTDYLDSGTKNEVYVRPGQSLVITLPSETIAARTQIGIKTLAGTAVLGSRTICQTNLYYAGMNSGSTITIQVPSDGVILSVTDLKIPGGIPADAAADSAGLQEGIARSLLWMGYTAEPETTVPETVPPETAQPEPTAPQVTPEPTVSGPADDGARDDAPAWSALRFYTSGSRVAYNGRIYEAKRRTIGFPPAGSRWSAWRAIR